MPCDVEIWSQLEEQSTSEESDEETDESADESEEETATTMEMLCENLVIEYISDEDSDYSLDESSEDSMEEESDEDVSMEMMSTENILETKRIPVPSEVDLWILKLDASESTDEDEMAIESDETTAAMLTEASLFGYESNNDSDFHADDDGSEDSMEYESDDEIDMEFVIKDNIIDTKRISKPSDVDLWVPMAEDESDDEVELETTAEMLHENFLNSSQDSDYCPDEASDDSLEYESDDETGVDLEVICEEDILAQKRVPKASEVDIWIPKVVDTEATVQMLLIDYDSSQDSDYCPSEASDDSLEDESDEEICLETISTENILESKRIRIHSEVDLWIAKKCDSLDSTLDSIGEDEESTEIVDATALIVEHMKSLRCVDKHPWLGETAEDAGVDVQEVQGETIQEVEQLRSEVDDGEELIDYIDEGLQVRAGDELELSDLQEVNMDLDMELDVLVASIQAFGQHRTERAENLHVANHIHEVGQHGELEQLRSNEDDAGDLAGDELDVEDEARDEARSVSTNVVNEIIEVVEAGAEEDYLVL